MFRCFVLLAACGKTSPAAVDAPDDASSDAAPRMITGRDVVRSARCVDASHVPVLAEQPWHSLTVATAAGPLAVAGDGSFAFSAPDGPARVTTTEDANPPTAFDF